VAKPDRTRFYEEAVHTPDKKVDCCPEIFTPALARAETLFVAMAAEDPNVLKLISLRTNYMHNGNLMNMRALKRGAHAENAIHIQPDDARDRELAEGEIAEIWNENGRLRAPVKFDSTLLRGVVALAHGYGHARSPGTSLAAERPGVNANALMPTGPARFEPLSNMSHMTGIPVSVGKPRLAS
jgi:anaerobic selenocysteine-containing dehydrogenase